MIACQGGHDRCVRALLHHGANVNETDTLKGQSSLMSVCLRGLHFFYLLLMLIRITLYFMGLGHLACCKLLMESPNVDVNAANKDGWVALMQVIIHPDVV